MFRSAPLAFLALALAAIRFIQPPAAPAPGTVGALALPIPHAVVEGVIVEDPRVFPLRDATLLLVDAVAPAPGRVRVSLHWAAPALRYGDRVRITGALVAPAGPTNPGQSDFRAALARRGVFAIQSAWRPRDVIVLWHDAGSRLGAALVNVRHWATGRLTAVVGPPESDLLAAMVFGLRGGFTPEVEESFQLTGLVYVLVVAGLHVGLLAWMCLTLLESLRVPRLTATLLTAGVLGLYAVLCGGELPIVRALVMFGALLGARALGRPASPMNALGGAACLILLAEPGALRDRSFQFSFAATFGVMALAPRLVARRGRLPKWVAEAGACTLAAQLALVPLLAASFGSVPLTGALSNFLVPPVLGVFIAGGLLVLLAGWIPWAGAALGAVLKTGLAAMLTVVAAFARLPLASVVAPPFSPAGWIAYLLWALGGLLWLATLDRKPDRDGDWPVPEPGRPRWPRHAALAGAAGLAALAWRAALAPPPGDLAVTFLDIGQGLSTVIRLPSGRALLWDAGPEFAGSTVVAPYLKHEALGRLAGVLLTHSHTDHCGGMAATLRQVGADWLALSGQGWAAVPNPYARGGARAPAFAETMDAAASRRVPVRLVRDGFRIEGEPGVTLTIWHPPSGFMPSALAKAKDENSLVLAIRWRGATALLPGDIQGRGERRLTRRAAAFGPVGLLEASHHGSLYGNTRAWLAACAPRLAVASAGAHNRFGHPHRATVIRYRDQGTPLWVTGRAGAVTAVTHGDSWVMDPAPPTFAGQPGDAVPLSGREEADIVNEGTPP